MKELQRKRLQTHAKKMLQYPYTYVYAPWGYGKSTWKRHLLHQSSSLYQAIEQDKNTPLSTILETNQPHLPYLYCIDDPEEDVWFEEGLEMEHVHLIYFSSTFPNPTIYNKIQDGTCYFIEPHTLLFTKHEILALWQAHHISLNIHEIDAIYEYSEGWPCAISILLEMHQRKEKHLSYHKLYQSLELAYTSILTKKEIAFLEKLSVLSSFTLEEAYYISKERHGEEYLHAILYKCSFLKKESDLYRFLPMFQKALRASLSQNTTLRKRCYLRAAEYYYMKKKYYEAFCIYYDFRDMNRILSMLETCDAYFVDQLSSEMIVLCLNQSTALKKRYPHGYLRILHAYVCHVDMFKGQSYLEAFQAFIPLHFEGTLQNELLGKAYLIRALLCHNNLSECGYYNLKAYHHLQNKIANQFPSPLLKTMGSYQYLFIYYVKFNEFKHHYQELYHRTMVYHTITYFTISSMILQIEAEYAYECGQYTLALSKAKKVLHIIHPTREFSTYAASLFTCGKAAILLQDEASLKDVYSMISKTLETTKGDHLYHLLECVQLQLYMMSDTPFETPSWISYLISRPPSQGVFANTLQAYISISIMAFHHQNTSLLYQMMHLLTDMYAHNAYAFVSLYLQLYTVMITAQEDFDGACGLLKNVLQLTEKDHIISIYLEFSKELYPLLSALPKCNYYRHILASMEKVLLFQTRKVNVSTSLSKKEYQVFLYLKEGLTRNEISQLEMVSVNTVKYHVKNIYKKLAIHHQRELLKKGVSHIASPQIELS